MKFNSKIITEYSENILTGETKTSHYEEVTAYKRVKGGYTKMYQTDYEQAQVMLVNSKKDIELFHQIVRSFSKTKIEVNLTHSNLKKICSKAKFSSFIKNMVTYKVVMRIDRGMYRLNPFVFLPFGVDAETVQLEWGELMETKRITELNKWNYDDRYKFTYSVSNK